MLKEAQTRFQTVRDVLRYAVSRFTAARLSYGHGSVNAYDEAAEHAYQLEQSRGLTYIPPYDHPLVIAGQGTVGMEILRQQHGGLDTLFVPCGGGGLLVQRRPVRQPDGAEGPALLQADDRHR